jgi:hypothetical protein
MHLDGAIDFQIVKVEVNKLEGGVVQIEKDGVTPPDPTDAQDRIGR